MAAGIVRAAVTVRAANINIKIRNENLEKINPQSINDIYKQDAMIVDFSDKMKKIDNRIKYFLMYNM